MKRIKALLLVAVLTLTCVAFTACSSDPKSLKGEEVNRLEWLQAFEYVSNGLAFQDKASSFTFNGSMQYYDTTPVEYGKEKELKQSMTFSIQVNKKVMYAEVTMTSKFNEQTFEENSYIYIDNSGKEEKAFVSEDKKEWEETFSEELNLSAISSAVNSLKNENFKFNKKTNMYEMFSYGRGYSKLKFYDKKLVYAVTESESSSQSVIVELSFTNYDKTEIKQEKPTAEENKLEKAYEQVRAVPGSSYAELSEDGSYIDVTYNVKGEYTTGNEEYIEALNKALDLPEEVLSTIQATSLMGERKKVNQNGIIVTWVKSSESSYKVTYLLAD